MCENEVNYMANFNSISEWKKHLEESVIKSLQEIANEIYEDWRYRIRGEIYSYNPKTYEKTGMLLDSIRISDVKKQGSLYEITKRPPRAEGAKLFFDSLREKQDILSPSQLR